MMKRGESGNSLLEMAMFLPFLFLLLFGMVEFARVGYVYYTLHKAMYSLARYVGTQQGVNFCDDADAVLSAAKQYILTGSTDGSGEPFLPNLNADMIRVRAEKYSAENGELLECACDSAGCDAEAGGTGPHYIVVSLPEGYPVSIAILFMAQVDPIPLRPQVRVPFGGT
jgi:hypothetical protein